MPTCNWGVGESSRDDNHIERESLPREPQDAQTRAADETEQHTLQRCKHAVPNEDLPCRAWTEPATGPGQVRILVGQRAETFSQRLPGRKVSRRARRAGNGATGHLDAPSIAVAGDPVDPVWWTHRPAGQGPKKFPVSAPWKSRLVGPFAECEDRSPSVCPPSMHGRPWPASVTGKIASDGVRAFGYNVLRNGSNKI